MNKILQSAVLRDYVYLISYQFLSFFHCFFFTPSALHFYVFLFFLHAMNDEHDDNMIVTSTH